MNLSETVLSDFLCSHCFNVLVNTDKLLNCVEDLDFLLSIGQFVHCVLNFKSVIRHSFIQKCHHIHCSLQHYIIALILQYYFITIVIIDKLFFQRPRITAGPFCFGNF